MFLSFCMCSGSGSGFVLGRLSRVVLCSSCGAVYVFLLGRVRVFGWGCGCLRCLVLRGASGSFVWAGRYVVVSGFFWGAFVFGV